MKRPISKVRRTVQLLSFLLLVYGGVLFKKQFTVSWLPYVKATPGFRVAERLPHLITPPEQAGVFDFFLPIRSSPFARNTGLFRGCFLYFLSENITYLTPLGQFLPHVVFYIICVFLLGMLWCGWICPLGYLQDCLAMLRRALHIPQLRVSELWQKSFHIFAYVQLGLILIVALLIAFPVFSWESRKQLFNLNSQLNPGDYIFPYITGFNHSPIEIAVTNPLSLILKITMIVFLLFLLASFFVKVSYCRICPLGALNGFFNRGGGISIEKEVSKCTCCGSCYLTCPMQFKHIYLEKEKRNVDRTFCIRCFRCVDICPESGCLKVKFFKYKLFQSG